jgi:hypothetical protein
MMHPESFLKLVVSLWILPIKKRIEEELVRSNQELAQFAYIASHDLQTPLRSITGFLSLLSRRYKGKLGAEADEFITFAMEGAERMKKLISDILAFSNVAAKGEPFEFVDSREPLDQALRNLRTHIEESGAEITTGELPKVTADRSQLEQLFQNLVGNAIKYRKSEELPRIHIAVVEKKAEWEFQVRDMASALTRNLPNGFSRFSNGCKALANILAPASALLSAGRSWNATAARFGWSRSRGRARPSFLLCQKHSHANPPFIHPSWRFKPLERYSFPAILPPSQGGKPAPNRAFRLPRPPLQYLLLPMIRPGALQRSSRRLSGLLAPCRTSPLGGR